MKTALLQVEAGSPRQAAEKFFRTLLDRRVVDALIVPREVPSRRMVVPALVTSGDGLSGVNPFAPVAIINAARAVSRLAFQDPGVKVGAVLRPCEIRALVEMAKLQQVTLERVLIIGVDCLGTFEPADYYRLAQEGLDTGAWLAQAAGSGKTALNGAKIRTACSICEAISPSGLPLTLHWVGCDTGRELYLSWDEGQLDLDALLDGSGVLVPQALPAARQSLVESLRKERRELGQEMCRDFASRTADINRLLDELAPCLGCHNCREVCPLCVCRECVFDSNLFEHEPSWYLHRAAIRGGLELPADTLLYHLTRMHHMGVSCVGCGQCESGCPSRIPLTLLFRTIGEKLQGLFSYVPGASVDELPPLATYREDELEPR